MLNKEATIDLPEFEVAKAEKAPDVAEAVVAPEQTISEVKLSAEDKKITDFFGVEDMTQISQEGKNITKFVLTEKDARELFGVKPRGGKKLAGFNSGTIGGARVKYTIKTERRIEETDEYEMVDRPYSVSALEKRGPSKTEGTIEIRYGMGEETYTSHFKVENVGYGFEVQIDEDKDTVIEMMEVAKRGSEKLQKFNRYR